MLNATRVHRCSWLMYPSICRDSSASNLTVFQILLTELPILTFGHLMPSRSKPMWLIWLKFYLGTCYYILTYAKS